MWVPHPCNPSTWKIETRGLIQSHPLLCSKFVVRLNYRRLAKRRGEERGGQGKGEERRAKQSREKDGREGKKKRELSS